VGQSTQPSRADQCHIQLSTPFVKVDQINRSEIIKHNANSLVKAHIKDSQLQLHTSASPSIAAIGQAETDFILVPQPKPRQISNVLPGAPLAHWRDLLGKAFLISDNENERPISPPLDGRWF